MRSNRSAAAPEDRRPRASSRTILRIGGEPGERQQLAPERHGDVPEPAVDLRAGQEPRGVAHLHRIAGGRGERLVHVGDQRPRPAARAVRHRDQRPGERAGVLQRRHEGARAAFHVEDQRVEPGGELLRQDRGGDQVDRFHRRGDVADRVEAPVGRGDVRGLADDRAADLGDHPAQGLRVGLGAVAGDRVELVERAAGMAEPAARDHRHIGAAGGERRGEHQADVVADPAGRMLVDHRAGQVPAQHRAGIAHRLGQRHALVGLHAAEEHRHGEGRDLALRDRLGGQPLDHEADLLGAQPPPVALLRDDLLRQHQ
jgi:hypothetical protein